MKESHLPIRSPAFLAGVGSATLIMYQSLFQPVLASVIVLLGSVLVCLYGLLLWTSDKAPLKRFFSSIDEITGTTVVESPAYWIGGGFTFVLAASRYDGELAPLAVAVALLGSCLFASGAWCWLKLVRRKLKRKSHG